MTAHKVEPAIVDPGRKMSLSELIRQLNEGKLKVVKIRYKKGDGYYASMGVEFPVHYSILEVRPGLVVYKLGGDRKALTPGRGVYYRVPAAAKPREGFAIAEIRGELVYLYLE